MKFSHTADCHIGGHRDLRLRSLTEQCFERFVTISIAERVDFAIIAGDLFNTAIPGIDTLKSTVVQLSRFREKGIPVYAIPGSHDYSPSGKTMLDVLEEAGLLKNVCRGTVNENGTLRLSFTQDKSGVKLTGVIGKRGMLDRSIYEDLDPSIGNEPGPKVFLFHTALTELKPQHLADMESYPISFLPQGFDYYAGGHVHIVQRYEEKGRTNVVYPGPLFPNSFSELERLEHGGFYLYDNGEIRRQDITLKNVVKLRLSVEGMDAREANAALLDLARSTSARDAIVLLRIEGMLLQGNTTDIDVREAVHIIERQGAFIVLRNTSRMSSPDFTSLQIKAEDPQQIEDSLLREHADQLQIFGGDGTDLTKNLLKLLSREPIEGEKLYEYQDRIVRDALELLSSK